jgi:hypothetical protein
MDTEMKKALEAYREGKEYHPAEKWKTIPALPGEKGGKWIIW